MAERTSLAPGLSRWRAAVIVAAAGLLLAPPPASGQTPEARLAAESLFTEGTKKLESKDYAGACKAFEASHKLDPGIGVLLYMADCYEKMGRVASAWAAFREAASLAKSSGQGEREAVAARRAASLEPKLPRATVRVGARNAETPGFVVRRDGVVVAREAWAAALPIDPGPHTYEAEAPGKQPLRIEVTVSGDDAARVTLNVTIEDLKDAPAPPPSATTPPAASSPPPAETTAAAQLPPPSPRSWQKTTGLVMGGVGLVGLGLGAYLGLHARSLDDDASAHCRPEAPSRCDARGVSLGHDARSAANFSTLSFSVGGAMLAGGLVLFLLPSSPSASARAPRLTPLLGARSGGAVLEGSW